MSWYFPWSNPKTFGEVLCSRKAVPIIGNVLNLVLTRYSSSISWESVLKKNQFKILTPGSSGQLSKCAWEWWCCHHIDENIQYQYGWPQGKPSRAPDGFYHHYWCQCCLQQVHHSKHDHHFQKLEYQQYFYSKQWPVRLRGHLFYHV